MKKTAEQIIEKIQNKKFLEIRDDLVELNVVSLAEVVDDLDPKDTLIFFRMMPKNISADVFSYLSIEQQTNIIDSVTPDEIKQIVEELYLDDMVDMLEELPANMVKKILKHTPIEQRNLINSFLNYAENTAGSIMTIEYVSLKKHLTVKAAIDYIRKIEVDKETIYNCFITDEKRVLEGIISLRDLVTNSDNTLIADIMDRHIISVATTEDTEEVANLFKKYDLLSMPVVDHENRITGIITIDDVIDVIDDVNTEDFERMAAMTPSTKEYLDSTPYSLAKNRIVWLLVLMISATFTGNIIRRYEDLLAQLVILTSFVPMLMDTGGNAGSQSATLIIRGLALGEIEFSDYWEILKKEFSVSILVGLALSSVNFLRVVIFEKVDMMTALVVSLTIMCTVLIANLTGGMLPIIARKFKLDPAIMASPLITTIVDATTLIIYFSIAKTLLKI